MSERSPSTDKQILLDLVKPNGLWAEAGLNWREGLSREEWKTQGVTFNAQRQVEYIALTHKNLGSIPAELGQLSQLKDLNLENNQLTGPIPPELEARRRAGLLQSNI